MFWVRHIRHLADKFFEAVSRSGKEFDWIAVTFYKSAGKSQSSAQLERSAPEATYTFEEYLKMALYLC